MAANRYDKPVNYSYVDQFVPIPFEELMTLGNYYAKERKQAEQDLSEYIRRAGDFHSLIDKDNETYHNTSFNPHIRARLEEAAQNPSVMKDAMWRAGMMRDLNSVDYSTLSKLRASAEAAKEYDKAMKKLALEGRMPEGWMPNYFSTYSTADSGVFDKTPVPYYSINELVHPLVDNLEDSYLWTKGGYDYYGVDDKTALRQVNEHLSEIMRNPTMQQHVALMGYDKALDAVKTAALEKTRINRKANPFAMLDMQEKYRRSRTTPKSRGKDEPENKPADFTVTAQLDTTGAYIKGREKHISDTFLDLAQRDPKTKAAIDSWRLRSMGIGGKNIFGTQDRPWDQYTTLMDIPEVAELYDSVRNGYNDPKNMFVTKFNSVAENGKLTANSITTATRNILGQYGTTITNDAVSRAIQLQLPNKEGEGTFEDTEFGKNVTLSSSRGLRLPQSYFYSFAGGNVSNIDPAFDKFDRDLMNGIFNGLIVRTAENLIQIPTGYNTEELSSVVTVSIPYEQLVAKGYTDQDIERLGGVVETTPVKESKRLRPSGNVDSTTVSGGGNKYVTIRVLSDVATDGLNAEYLNSAQHKQTLGTSGAADIHPDVQYDAYNDDLDVMDVLRFIDNEE